MIFVVGGIGAVLYRTNIQFTHAASRKIAQQQPLNVLVIGTTHKGAKQANMVLASINPSKQKTLLTVIPQNEQTIINGYRSNDEVQVATAYNSGGVATAAQTIRELMRVPVDNYIVTDAATGEKVVKTGSLKSIKAPIKTNLSKQKFQTVRKNYFDSAKVIDIQQLQGKEQNDLLVSTPREINIAQQGIKRVID